MSGQEGVSKEGDKGECVCVGWMFLTCCEMRLSSSGREVCPCLGRPCCALR